jgi:cyanate permease
MANSAVLLHQVGVMEAAGLSIAAASGFAGARGFCQIAGRLLLTFLTSHLGTRGSLALSYLAGATATLSLLAAYYVASPTVAGVYFAIIGGMAFGLLSPLHGLFQVEVYGDARLGTLTAVGVVLGSAAGALGGWLVGLAFDATGSYRAPLVVIASVQVLAIAALLWQRRARQGRREPA